MYAPRPWTLHRSAGLKAISLPQWLRPQVARGCKEHVTPTKVSTNIY